MVGEGVFGPMADAGNGQLLAVVAALSPVLTAMGVPLSLGKGAVRLSVGRFTTEDEIDRAAAALVKACGG